MSCLLKFNNGTSVDINKATQEELTLWINEAENIQDRTQRKQLTFYRRYNSSSSLKDIFKTVGPAKLKS